ncbi:MAG: TIGR04149 family rSAM-modified RiPP [Bacteroidaceae bacterium]|nr:TIGR04149 family rSAM-modified RiPP [Bacteroidaceae bacterium]
MKKIKPITLKNATALTNNEMKKIRGGYDMEPSATCVTACPDGSLGRYDCSTEFGSNALCTSSSNGYVICYFVGYNGIDEHPRRACPDVPPTPTK